MDTDGIEALERRRLQALVDGDIEQAEQLHAPDYELITPGGAALSRERYLDLIASGAIRYEVFAPASPVRTRAAGDMALVRYQARIVLHDAEGATDSGLFWHTDTYERRDGRWQAVWSQATRIRSPQPE